MQARRRTQVEVRFGVQLADFLRRSRERILRHCEEARQDLARLGAPPSSPRLDDLPSLLDHIAAVAEEAEVAARQGRSTEAAARYAIQRLTQGFELGHVVQELGLLRDTVLELWEPVRDARPDALHELNRVLDDATAAAIDESTRAHDRALRAIDRVAADALEARDLASQRAAQLAASEQRFRATFEHAPVGVAHVALDGCWLRMNPRCCEILGYEDLALRGTRDHDLSRVRDLVPIDLAVPSLRSGTLDAYVGEHAYVRPTGEHRWIYLTASLVREDGDGPPYLIAILEDVTERRRSQDALRDREQQAQRSVMLRDRVLAIVSHDLKSPLGAIRMAVSLLQQTPALDDLARKYTDVIDRSSKRMDRLITDLLELASIESGRLALDLDLHDVCGIIADATAQHQVLANSKQIELAGSTPLTDVMIRCDRERILHVLGNLIGNALKFTRSAGRVDVEAHRVGDEIVFTVSDTGPGISPGELGHLFEAHWTSARTGSQGTGLGLYICQRIVEAHGGRIGARNRDPRGATFWFTLALAP